MLNKKEYLLTKLIEECLEIAKEASKALTFGLDNKYEKQELQKGFLKKIEIPKSNIEKMTNEWNDLMCIRKMLMEEGIEIYDDIGLQEEKRWKVEKYMELSRTRGCLEK